MLWPFAVVFAAAWPAFIRIARQRAVRGLACAATFLLAASAERSLAGADGPSAPPPWSNWMTRSWQTEDGLPLDTVTALVQTRDGFLWVGTGAGLARFDGVRFRKFGLQDGLRSLRITKLVEDRAGALWIGTSGGGVSRWDAGRFTSFEGDGGFPEGLEVSALAPGQDGSVWIGTDKGLVQWSGGTFKFLGEAEGIPRKQISAVLQDSHGTLWASALAGGLFRRVNGRFERIEGSNPKPSSIYTLWEDREGALWAGGGVLWKLSDGTWRRFDASAGVPDAGLPGTAIQSLAKSSDGTLWVGTRSQGLYRSVGERFERAVNDGPLATQSISAVIADREGSLWVGAIAGGLHRLSPRVLQFWGADAGLAPTTVTSVVEDGSGMLWVGTASRGIQRFENGRFTPLADPAVPASQIIYCTTVTSDGAIWAAGEQRLFRFKAGEPTKAFRDPPVRDEAIRALCADGDTLWLGTYLSTLLKCDAAGVEVVAPSGSFPGSISSIVREAANTLWIGTASGLHRWERGQVKTWTTRDGLPTANIRALHRDPDGTLWIGTLGGGLARMRDGRFAHFTTRDGLIDDVISQILADDAGALWLGCNRGIMRIERRELEAVAAGKTAELHPIVLGRNEGMLKEQCFGGTSPTALKTRDGHLFFPTVNGLAEIDPRRLGELTPATPQAAIDEVRVDQRASALDVPLVIAPGNHRVDVSYTAPVLRGGEWVRLRHKLEGFDHDWVDAEANRLASYDSLRPRNYIFRVAAADGKGGWSEPGASLVFTVQPFFWQTLWFRIGGGIVLVGINGGAVWWHTRSKHRREIAELERARQQQAELARVGRVALLGELSASLAHELNQPLAAILSNAQAGLRFLAGDSVDVNEVRATLTDIADADRRAGEIIRRMREMMKKGEAQMEPRNINADIEQVLVLLHSDLVARNVVAATEFQPGLPPVNGDHIQLQQVLINLIVNACDAMHDTPPDERRLLITTKRAADEMVQVSVKDRGAGVEPHVFEQIFNAFYSTKSNGLGMGLAICRAIIKAHGGLLWVGNNSEGGATFHFTLRFGDQTKR